MYIQNTAKSAFSALSDGAMKICVQILQGLKSFSLLDVIVLTSFAHEMTALKERKRVKQNLKGLFSPYEF